MLQPGREILLLYINCGVPKIAPPEQHRDRLEGCCSCLFKLKEAKKGSL